MHFFGGKITITAILYVLFAFTPITYVTLLVAVILLTTSFLFVASAQNGLASLTATEGRHHVPAFELSALRGRQVPITRQGY